MWFVICTRDYCLRSNPLCTFGLRPLILYIFIHDYVMYLNFVNAVVFYGMSVFYVCLYWTNLPPRFGSFQLRLHSCLLQLSSAGFYFCWSSYSSVLQEKAVVVGRVNLITRMLNPDNNNKERVSLQSILCRGVLMVLAWSASSAI